MRDLDEKLIEIAEHIREGGMNSGWNYDVDADIETIKQAFKNAGYRQLLASSPAPDNHINVYTPAKLGFEPIPEGTFAELMTGQEWYDRFEKELTGKGIFYRGHPEDVAETILGCKLAAKKAAGIE